MGSLRRHLYDQHDKMSRIGYQEKFPAADLSLPNWMCKVCNSGIKWARDNIFNHLKVHNITIDDYYNRCVKPPLTNMAFMRPPYPLSSELEH